MKVKAFLVALIVALFTAGAVMAQDAPGKSIDPYMSARIWVGYYTIDPGASGDAESDMIHALQSNSRFGIKGKNGKVSGQFELGAFKSAGEDLRLRVLQATYDAGMAKVTIGKGYVPYTSFSSQTSGEDCGCIGYGALYPGRLNQLKIEASGVIVSLVENTGEGKVGIKPDDTAVITLPQLVLGYKFKNDMLTIQPTFSYQAYDTAETGGVSVTSMMFALMAQVKVDALTVKLNAAYGTNLGDLGIAGIAGDDFDTTNEEDATTMVGYLAIGYDMGQFGINAGVGYATSDRDDYAEADTQMTYYVNVPIKLEKNFKITPEFAVYDQQKDSADADEPSETYIGVQFKADI